jgi:hypothetical protein
MAAPNSQYCVFSAFSFSLRLNYVLTVIVAAEIYILLRKVRGVSNIKNKCVGSPYKILVISKRYYYCVMSWNWYYFFIAKNRWKSTCNWKIKFNLFWLLFLKNFNILLSSKYENYLRITFTVILFLNN